MGHPLMEPTMSVDDFLAWDATQTMRHEFVDGEVFAMAGAEDRHPMVTGNLYIALHQHLAGTPRRACRVDIKLHVALVDSDFHPDIFVTCHAAGHASRFVEQRPTLIVEVLSPGTAADDRGDKFTRHRLIDSLCEDGVVDLDSLRTDIHRKGADGLWVLHPFDAAQTVRFDSVGVDISAERLFADVDPPAAPTNSPSSRTA